MKLMILDGNSIINRAFFGVRLLSTKDGLYTNAIFGFLNILEKLRSEENPDALCVAFDVHAPTFRHLQFDGYKAARRPMPEELRMQMPVMKDVLHAMHIPTFECSGWEADDILGTAGRICTEYGWKCVIVTGDRDSLQLVTDSVTVKLVTSRQGQTVMTNYTPEVFTQEYGFAPIHMIDLKGLMGDASDNLPGVAGVGPKTATALLTEYGTLDGIYQNLDAIKETVRKKLEAGKDSAYLSYDLATIRTDAPVDLKPENCLVQPPDNDALYALFVRMEFLKLIERYHLHVPGKQPETVQEFSGECVSEIVANAERAMALLSDFEEKPFVSVLCDNTLETVFIDDGKQMTVFSKESLRSSYTAVLERLFSASVKKISHDVKDLMGKLLRAELPADGFIFDTALAAYVLDATSGKYDINQLTVGYLGFEIPKFDAEKTGTDAAFMGELMSKTASVSALYEVLSKKLSEEGVDQLYYEIELPLCAVLANMEFHGVLVDQMALVSFSNLLSERIAADEAMIYEYAGEHFNINSTKQLGEILFEKLQLPAGKKTKNGYSTTADVLEGLREKHPIVPAILDYRMLSKLKSTYADGLVKEIAKDGRIHTTLQNMVTATGRLSSAEPNLQNIPVRTELGSEIRKMFIPADGCVFVDADYSQIELRVLAHIADDKRMQAAFLSGTDIHTSTAAQVFGVESSAVTPLMRRNAKAVNFGIVYGISEFSLSQDIGVSRKEARAYIDSYLANYEGVRDYMKNVVEQAKADGFVKTLFGRKRLLPELKSSNFQMRSFAERCALNSPIQGTAADIIKLAMLRVDTALRKANCGAKLLLQVHDELIVECPCREAERVRRIVADEMQQVMQLSVPLLAEAKSGASWYEAK